MATLRQEDFNKSELLVYKQAENKILKAQRKSKANITSYEGDDMYSSTLSREDWTKLRQDEQNNSCDDRVVNLFSMRSVFK